MFRKKSDGIHNRFKDTITVSTGELRHSGKKSILRILLTLIVIATIAGFICAIRSCNCTGNPVPQINPTNGTDTLKPDATTKFPSAQNIKPAKTPIPKQKTPTQSENQEQTPAKPEPKTVDLGTHVEIITH